MYLLHDRQPPTELVAAPGPRLARPFAARMEVAQAGALYWRLTVFGRTRAWLRSDTAQYDAFVLHAALPAQTGGLEPLRARTLPADRAPGSDAWWAAWAAYFARALARAPRGALPRGSYRLVPQLVCTPTHPRPTASREADARGGGYSVWLDEDAFAPQAPASDVDRGMQLLLSRVPSPPDAARVRMYRKHARAGTLPPALLLCVPMYTEFHVVLDGHDRLLAALLEGVRPRALALSPISASATPASAELARPGLAPCRVCAWRLPGGAARWRAEVTARLAHVAHAVPGALRRALLR